MFPDTVEHSSGGNTKTPSRKQRAWFITWNNPPETADTVLLGLAEKYAFQHEIGKSGTPHIQGCFYFKNARSFSQVQQHLPGVHIEPCKSWKDAIEYCTKEDTRASPFISNCLPVKVEDPLDITNKADWMIEIENILETKPDRRKIYWYYEKQGGIGKTTFCKHLCLTITNVLYASGKVSDIQYAIAEMDPKPTLILFDVPRSAAEYVNYQALEKVKDGIFFSGKYESKMVIMNNPHVICFANQRPNTNMLSNDRWIIKEL